MPIITLSARLDNVYKGVYMRNGYFPLGILYFKLKP